MKGRLQKKLTLWMAALCLLPLLLAGAWTATLARREMRRQVEAALRARAHGFAALVQSAVFDPLGRENVLRAWTKDAALTGKDCSAHLLEEIHGSHVLAAAVVLSRDGSTLCASDAALAVRSVQRDAPWLLSALDGSLASPGVSASVSGAPVLDLALATPAGSVLVVSYRWEIVRQMIEEVAAQARLADGSALQIVSAAGDVLFDSGGGASVPTTVLPAGAGGVREAAGFVEAWSRNDVAPTDPGASFSYLARLPASVAYAPANALVRALLLACIATAALGVTAAGALSRHLVRPIAQLSSVVDRIVREGDLTQTIEIASDDEMGDLAVGFRAMVEKLREIPVSLEHSVGLLASAMQRFNASAQHQRESIVRQATALQQTTVTAQELRQTSALASEKAHSVLQGVSRADKVSESGEAAANAGIDELARIQQHVDAIAARIAQLSESAQRIAGITETVKDLADQSNMLALNAAIEAVRSGEAGRGFAVVAREIRSLADQSIGATGRVRENLERIRGEVGQAAAVAEEGSRGVSSGIERVRGSGESLRELSAIARENAAAVRQIAAAIAQQNAGIDQVFSAVHELSARMSEIEQVLDSSDESVRALNDVSQRIAGIVRGYRV